MSGVARLIADGGTSAREAEFFRSTEFLEAEGVTHTLEVEVDGGVLKAPLIVNSIEGGGQDAISPYGYPGVGGGAGVRVDPSSVDFSETGLVTIFIRHRLDEVSFHSTRERNLVFVADPSMDRYSRPQDRQQVKRNTENGFETEILHGPDTPASDREGFARVYTETMERRKAKDRYFYPDAYFARILQSEQSHLAVTCDGDGEVAAASIVVLSDGFLHYYLTGSSEARWEESPTKNLVTALVDWSYELGLPLSLGGGIKEDDDKLAMFKRGFSNRTERWQTSEIVCNEEAYARLSSANTPDGFFPAYREPQ